MSLEALRRWRETCDNKESCHCVEKNSFVTSSAIASLRLENSFEEGVSDGAFYKLCHHDWIFFKNIYKNILITFVIFWLKNCYKNLLSFS